MDARTRKTSLQERTRLTSPEVWTAATSKAEAIQAEPPSPPVISQEDKRKLRSARRVVRCNWN